jgi:hypothetical protein
LPIAVSRPLVAWAGVSVEAFCIAAMNEARAAFPPADVSLASSAVRVATYVLRAAAALLVDSLCSGVNVLITPLLIWLMIVQSAAETPVAAAEEEAGALAAADVVAAGADAGALDELDELLLHPAMRAPPTARTASTVRDERWNISATSRGSGAELSVASHENLVLP